jgi:hypothetical protein
MTLLSRECRPKDKQKPASSPFFRATYCEVHLPESGLVVPESELVADYENLQGSSYEIQTCSMMAHAWNEVEHDID